MTLVTSGTVSTPRYPDIISVAITDMVQQGFKITQISIHFFGRSFVQEGDALKCSKVLEEENNITFVPAGVLGGLDLQYPFGEFHKKLEENGTYADVKFKVELTGIRHIRENNFGKRVRMIESTVKGPLRTITPAITTSS